MRRDVWRVGVGRFLFEAALGCVLAFGASDTDRSVVVGCATGAAFVTHLVARDGLRRAFLAAHVAMAAIAIGSHLDVHIAGPVLGVGLGIAIELTNLDHVQRRRVTEHVRSLRIPSSVIMRRVGSIVAVGVSARAAVALASSGARDAALAPICVVVGAVAALAAGFGAGPGRPVTRPVDALAFAVLGAVLVVRTT